MRNFIAKLTSSVGRMCPGNPTVIQRQTLGIYYQWRQTCAKRATIYDVISKVISVTVVISWMCVGTSASISSVNQEKLYSIAVRTDIQDPGAKKRLQEAWQEVCKSVWYRATRARPAGGRKSRAPVGTHVSVDEAR
jgi:hypothetical protein